MPHWIKKFVNAMVNSGKASSSREMTFRGGKINLEMINNCIAYYEYYGEVRDLVAY